jgi:phosphatidylglycerol:prolipoprotein diacylglycerol transferase
VSFIAAITINLDPVLIRLGPIALRWYGLMYLVGIAAGVQIALPYAQQRGLDHDRVLDALGWGFVGGLLGGRLYYVVQQPLEPYLAEPWRIIAVWEGGMAFFGAIAGAAIALALFCRRNAFPYWTLLDAAAIFATVGQFFGRIGNIVNGDVLGYPTDLPWGFVYLHPDSFAPEKGVAYQPAPLYEMLANVIILLILWRFRFAFRQPGLLFALYLGLYAVSQLVVFFWRDNVVIAYGLKQAQLTALVVLVIAAALALWLQRRSTHEGPGQTAGASGAS